MKPRFVGCSGLVIAILLMVVYVETTTATHKAFTPMSTNEPMTPSMPAQQTCCPIVELRQYTLHPGKRDVLIELFDREFVETQEAAGMKIIGQFRDLDNPDRFVWLRGFPDMSSRAQSLTEFYRGPVWKAHSEVANATMVDSTNVLLLHPSSRTSGFSFETNDRLPPGAKAGPGGLVIATIYYFNAPVGSEFIDFFEHDMQPVITGSGGKILAHFVTENSPNTFPGLPVREGEQVFVWFMSFADQAGHQRYAADLSASKRWQGEISKALARRLKRPPEVLRLSPTTRSLLHGWELPSGNLLRVIGKGSRG